ncbi:hypothetical protein [Streptomyces sp. NPDC093676]|uniref:hypothetical protein n=1 Tax=Streptomyces sp. NPDC093676 TaxID=3366050 RepID=UPI003823BF8D
MADHSTHPPAGEDPARAQRIANLHRLCDEDYAKAQAWRQAQNHRDDTDQPRCPSAHRDDPTPCSGPIVVTVLDSHNNGVNGCEHHGARILASLTGGRVYALPDAPSGAAIRVFKTASTLRPFAWYTGGENA